MKEKIKKTYLGSRSVYLTRLEPTVLVVGGVEVVMKSINKKNMLANKKKRNKKNLPGETRLFQVDASQTLFLWMW